MRTWIKKLLLVLCLCSICQADWGSLEDFTGYTEVDGGSDITVAKNVITMTDFQTRLVTSYVYSDKDAAHFNDDFSHRFISNMSAMNASASGPGYVCVYGLTSIIGDRRGVGIGGGDAIWAFFGRDGGGYKIYFQLYENGSGVVTDIYTGFSLSTDYYFTATRDYDGGVNNTGRYTLYICTSNYYGETGANLVDTLLADSSAGQQNDFRYVETAAGYDDNDNSYSVSGTISNLDLGEAAPPTGGGGQVIMVEEI